MAILAALAASSVIVCAQPAATPTPDRLATPVVPSSPTPVDLGRKVFYQDCMPCHGDHGQGLTDEWRAVWVEDHQNCWARGCHGGRADDEGFPIPRDVPAVIGTGLGRFADEQALFDFLRQTQPPQRPGDLSEADYRAVTAFLMSENGRYPDRSSEPAVVPTGAIILIGAAIAIGVTAIARRARSDRSGPDH